MELRNESAQQAGGSIGMGHGGGFPGVNMAPVYGVPTAAAPVVAATGGLGLGSDLIGLALLSGLFGGGGGFFGRSACIAPGFDKSEAMVSLAALLNEKGLNDVRRDTKESESEIRESILNSNAQTANGFNNVLSALCGNSKDALAANYQGVISNLQSQFALQNAITTGNIGLDRKIDCETNALKLQNFNLQTNFDKSFCHLEHEMERGFNRLNERALIDKTETLSRELGALQSANQTAQLASFVQSAVQANNASMIQGLVAALSPECARPVVACMPVNPCNGTIPTPVK